MKMPRTFLTPTNPIAAPTLSDIGYCLACLGSSPNRNWLAGANPNDRSVVCRLSRRGPCVSVVCMAVSPDTGTEIETECRR